MKPRAVIVFIIILVGFFLWFLAAEVPLDLIFGLVGTATVIGACGVSLVALGMASLTHFFGRGYLKAFLTLGLLVGLPVSFAVSLLHSSIGFPVSLLVIYLAVELGAFYGSIAGTLGAVAYHVLRSKRGESKPQTLHSDASLARIIQWISPSWGLSLLALRPEGLGSKTRVGKKAIQKGAQSLENNGSTESPFSQLLLYSQY